MRYSLWTQSKSETFWQSLEKNRGSLRKPWEKNYAQKAEETITSILASDTFSIKERTDYWKRKWNKDHLFTNVALGAILAVAFAAGIFLSGPLVIGSIPILALIVFLKRRNDMMIYVENNLYGPEK